jgi:PadR family transcriptional regulator, regulatory protein PadR
MLDKRDRVCRISAVPERITKQLLTVLEVLMSAPEREWYGMELIQSTKLTSGTLYPILHRLVADGWLERTRDEPSEVGGTGRRLYGLTGVGARAATELLAERVAARGGDAVPRERRPVARIPRGMPGLST